MRMMLSGLILSFAATTAMAQPIEDAPVTTKAGQEVRLGAYAAFKRDCSGGVAAEIRPAGDQRGGAIVVTSGTLSTSRVPGCGTVTAAAHLLFYRPNPDFAGTDRASFDVRDPLTGASQPHVVTITVTP